MAEEDTAEAVSSAGLFFLERVTVQVPVSGKIQLFPAPYWPQNSNISTKSLELFQLLSYILPSIFGA